ncbi:unnamed protein product [Caenorhabditis bovis]|uniref:Transcription initiation factor TFIID subunit 9 n=1 Tax=Caenorhabditis bovis TaxID=2654633 RepID=A0A8S1EP29_9PELO|nr:unnamed protein product [Caenorhabditis bovis]
MADAEKDMDTSMGEGGNGSIEVAAIQEILADCGVEEYDPRVVGMLMDAQYALTVKVLEMANGLAKHNGKAMIEEEDVQTASDILGVLKSTIPDRQKMIQMANDKNLQPLPQIRHNYGLKLPNDRFCQLQPNVLFKSEDHDAIMPQIVNTMPLSEPNEGMIRPDQVSNILKRRGDEDDFDN